MPRLVPLHIVSLEFLENWWHRVINSAEFEYLIRISISSTVMEIFKHYCPKMYKKIGARLVFLHIISS